MKVKAEAGNSEIGNRQRIGNSEKGIGKRVQCPIPYCLLAIPHIEPQTLYTPFSIRKS